MSPGWVDFPIARVPAVVYDGQTVRLPANSYSEYTWVSSDPDKGQVYYDPSTKDSFLLFNLSGITTKSVVDNKVFIDTKSLADTKAVTDSYTKSTDETEAGSNDIVFTAVEKAHPEYTYDLKVSLHPWSLAFMSTTGDFIDECTVGSTVSLCLVDLVTGRHIDEIWDGNTIDSKREVKLQFSDPTFTPATSDDSASSENFVAPVSSDSASNAESAAEGAAQLISSGSFYARYQLDAPGIYTFTVTLLNGCPTDTDVTSTATLVVE